jgi:hypothetical protein
LNLEKKGGEFREEEDRGQDPQVGKAGDNAGTPKGWLVCFQRV